MGDSMANHPEKLNSKPPNIVEEGGRKRAQLPQLCIFFGN